jgi:DNA-binding MarR family transcriptional regulator
MHTPLPVWVDAVEKVAKCLLAIFSKETKQGQYLAFIYAYSRMFRRPPAEADMQRHFRVSPPSVHQMVLTIERAGFIRRQPGVARSIELLVAPENLPILK